MTEFHRAQSNDWCHFCKCFVNPHANSKRMHEQSNNHKKNVEIKMREIRKSSQNEAKQEEMAKQMMSGIEARAAEAYRADLAAAERPEDAHGPQLMSADARLRQEQETAKRKLEDAVETELKVRAEAEYRSQLTKVEWKFDNRSSYYWHAKSSCYFDPKSGMYFNTKANTWSKQASPDTPPPPDTGATTASAPIDSGAQLAEEEEYALGPFARAAKSMQPMPAPATVDTAPAGAVATAGQASKAAGWAHTPTGNQPVGSLASSAKPRGMTSMFNLGYGTNHPKYEAARARTQGAAQRTMEAAGGRSFQAEGAKKLGLVTKGGDQAGKRKREEGGALPKAKVSKEEAEALAKRAAARARVEARTMRTFGLN